MRFWLPVRAAFQSFHSRKTVMVLPGGMFQTVDGGVGPNPLTLPVPKATELPPLYCAEVQEWCWR